MDGLGLSRRGAWASECFVAVAARVCLRNMRDPCHTYYVTFFFICVCVSVLYSFLYICT